MHEDVARRSGLSDEVLAAIKQGRRPDFDSTDDAAVYDYCSELFETKFVSDAVYQRALAAISTRGIVELTALVGYYAMVAMSVNAHQLPIPAVKPKPRTP
jgi:4-carboxymuconolactone decarboxylase